LRSFVVILVTQEVRLYGLYGLLANTGTVSVSVRNVGVLSGKNISEEKADLEIIRKM